MKRILIIGAGFLQTFIIKKAKELGYYTIVIDKNPDSEGFQFADEYEVIDIVDQEASLKFAMSKNIDGVMTAATDYGVLSASYIAKKLNLPGIDYEVAKIIKDKYLVRKNLFENKIDDVSQFYEIDEIEKLNGIIDTIKFPVMVKPSDGSGSKAAKRVDDVTELFKACQEAIKSSLIKKALIEDFIDGKEYGVESFVFEEKVYILGVMEKKMTAPPKYAELGHSIPSQLTNEDKVKDIVNKAISSLSVNYGAINMDVLITNEGDVCIIDVGARMGGNLIGSHIIPIATGIDYMEVLIKTCVQDNMIINPKEKVKSIVTKILALSPGKISGLPNFEILEENFKVDIFHKLEIGTEIKEYHNNLDGLGYIVSYADDLQAAHDKAEEVKRIIDSKISRE